jgi:hypothetical protein
MRPLGLLPGVFASVLCAQQGQTAAPEIWPCVPGRAVDPSYLEVSEATGGQLFLLQKGEVEHALVMINASHTHPATVIRAVGHLSGSREFEFPVDSKTASILLMASLQCRSAIVLTRPNGAEMTAYNSVRNIDLKAGRIVQVDAPEPGKWKVRLAGTGLFVLSVTGKTEIGIGSVAFLEGNQRRTGPVLGIHQALEIHVKGDVSGVGLHLVGPGGEFLSGLESPELVAQGTYRNLVSPPEGGFRIVVTGVDANADPFQRTYPNLFRAVRPK